MKQINYWLLCGIILLNTHSASAQNKYLSRNGNIVFNSGTSLETIEGTNHKAASVLDAATGQLEFSVLVKAFEFERALMEDHFNENYMESDKFPKASFKGAIINNKEINYSQNGNYTAQVKGDLTIHGITRPVLLSANIVMKDQKIIAKSSFEILIQDFGIDIPSLVKDKIDKHAKIIVDIIYESLNK
jgi:polyisoprenoid-binding protein YceI